LGKTEGHAAITTGAAGPRGLGASAVSKKVS
jgi:hypothetical protein